MAGPKDKRKKTKTSYRSVPGFGTTFKKTTPTMRYSDTTYAAGSTKDGESKVMLTQLKGNKVKNLDITDFKTRDINPNQNVTTTKFSRNFRAPEVFETRGSTQKGNKKLSTKNITPKKSGAGYSGD